MRKTLYLSITLLCCLALSLPSITYAHPGRTDSNGGHTCRTNCEKWGLEYGEYHYHNGSGGSDSDSSSGSKSNSNSESGADSNETSESSSNNKKSTPSESKPESEPKPESKPEPEPKIDKKQIQADEHYQNAINYFNNDKFHDALEELNDIYDLDRTNNKTDELMQNSLTAIYQLAESNLDSDNYTKSTELLDSIVDYQHSPEKIKEKAEALLKDVISFEKIANLLSDAKTAKDNKEYKEAISFIDEANELKETEEVSNLFDTTMDDIMAEAETAYFKNEFEKANNLYGLLEQHIKSEELKEDYQTTIQHIQDLLNIQEKYDLKIIDVNKDSLFNHLIDEDKEPNNDSNIIDTVTSYITKTKQEEVIPFIFDIHIKELLTGGQQHES